MMEEKDLQHHDAALRETRCNDAGSSSRSILMWIIPPTQLEQEKLPSVISIASPFSRSPRFASFPQITFILANVCVFVQGIKQHRFPALGFDLKWELSSESSRVINIIHPWDLLFVSTGGRRVSRCLRCQTWDPTSGRLSHIWLCLFGP